MSDQEEPQSEPALPATTGPIKFGETTVVTAEAKAAGIARGNIQVQDADAETLQLPEVVLRSSPTSELDSGCLNQYISVLLSLLLSLCHPCRKAPTLRSCKNKLSKKWSSEGG